MDVVATAQGLADEVLFPAAVQTDAADVVPAELLDAVAQAGLYGLAGPEWAGGLDADFPSVCGAVEALASGCLTTTFVWAQHIGAVRAAATSDTPAIRDWVPLLCRGDRRAGLALGGSLPGPPAVRAWEVEDGWILSGTSPFVSGWGRIDLVHVAARTDDQRVVWAFVDAQESDNLTVEPLSLVALNATSTCRVHFADLPVSTARVTSVVPFSQGATPVEPLRIHAAMALGVIDRCCRLLGPTGLDPELERVRRELDRLDAATMQGARAAAGELALRAAAALMVTTGSRSLLLGQHPQRLAREALFALTYALRPGSRDAALKLLRTVAEAVDKQDAGQHPLNEGRNS